MLHYIFALLNNALTLWRNIIASISYRSEHVEAVIASYSYRSKLIDQRYRFYYCSSAFPYLDLFFNFSKYFLVYRTKRRFQVFFKH
jgi:hypothetical protein